MTFSSLLLIGAFRKRTHQGSNLPWCGFQV
jgi:hypothetical protein